MNYFFANIMNTILVSKFFDNNYYTFLLTRTLGMYFLVTWTFGVFCVFIVEYRMF